MNRVLRRRLEFNFKKMLSGSPVVNKKDRKKDKTEHLKLFSKSALDKLKCLNLLLVSLPRKCKPWIYLISYCCGLERTDQLYLPGSILNSEYTLSTSEQKKNICTSIKSCDAVINQYCTLFLSCWLTLWLRVMRRMSFTSDKCCLALRKSE